MQKIEKTIGIFMLLVAIGFNLWLYRLEPTAAVDPNDNTFQYALVHRTNQIWDYANKTCSGNILSLVACRLSLLADHWVPNWAEGYNLPYYYSHLPQITIVASYRFFHSLFLIPYSLFAYYHCVIYLLLALFPLSVFLSLRIINLPWMTAGIGALIAAQISTDGFYGLDPSSFLWRGYGLSSQLFAMIWLPLALAYAFRFFETKEFGSSYIVFGKFKTHIPYMKYLIPAVFSLAAAAAGHLGIGIIAFLSIGILAVGPTIQAMFNQKLNTEAISQLKKNLWKTLLVFGGVGLLLGYWIVPILLHGNYHNISFWDPVWKFDSYGAKEVLTRLFNGDLFDFGRLPILTALVGIGFFISLLSSGLSSFSFLFLFWLLMYFGRTTWGSFIDLIPGMREFHLSRFIVGVHLAGLFLAPIAIEWLASRITDYGLRITKSSYIRLLAYVFIGVFVYFSVYPQTIRYAAHNDVLIKQANQNYAKQEKDVSLLLSTLNNELSTSPGRVFAGRGGAWGRNFQIAETPYYMHLSTYGIPTVMWLPQTWSPNADTEQYFSEDKIKDYTLYNIRYVAAPSSQETQPFWKLMKESPSWKLYEVETGGYITTGVRPAIVSTDKETFLNVVRLWIQSDDHKNSLYPELTFDSQYPKTTGLPNFRMLDEVTYQVPDGSTHNLFAEPPLYLRGAGEDSPLPTITSQSDTSDMVFKASVEVTENCGDCLVILKQTFHPSWRATIDGKPAKTLTVFPFYTAVTLETAGTHEVVFTYQPSGLKMVLFSISVLTLGVIIFNLF